MLEGYRFAEDFVFTKAFRRRFQVPEEATSIADRILQKQHHDWIEAYLVQQQAVALVPVIRDANRHHQLAQHRPRFLSLNRIQLNGSCRPDSTRASTGVRKD